jgi:hypothetical protein
MEQLVAMGFPEHQARKALRERPNADAAINYIFNNSDKDEAWWRADPPIPAPAPASAAAAAVRALVPEGVARGMGMDSMELMMRAIGQQRESESASSAAAAGALAALSNASIEQMVSLGIDEDHARLLQNPPAHPPFELLFGSADGGDGPPLAGLFAGLAQQTAAEDSEDAASAAAATAASAAPVAARGGGQAERREVDEVAAAAEAAAVREATQVPAEDGGQADKGLGNGLAAARKGADCEGAGRDGETLEDGREQVRSEGAESEAQLQGEGSAEAAASREDDSEVVEPDAVETAANPPTFLLCGQSVDIVAGTALAHLRHYALFCPPHTDPACAALTPRSRVYDARVDGLQVSRREGSDSRYCWAATSTSKRKYVEFVVAGLGALPPKRKGRGDEPPSVISDVMMSMMRQAEDDATAFSSPFGGDGFGFGERSRGSHGLSRLGIRTDLEDLDPVDSSLHEREGSRPGRTTWMLHQSTVRKNGRSVGSYAAILEHVRVGDRIGAQVDSGKLTFFLNGKSHGVAAAGCPRNPVHIVVDLQGAISSLRLLPDMTSPKTQDELETGTVMGLVKSDQLNLQLLVSKLRAAPYEASIVDRNGRAPLHYICRDQPSVGVEMLRELATADPSMCEAADCDGATPLMYLLDAVRADQKTLEDFHCEYNYGQYLVSLFRGGAQVRAARSLRKGVQKGAIGEYVSFKGEAGCIVRWETNGQELLESWKNLELAAPPPPRAVPVELVLVLYDINPKCVAVRRGDRLPVEEIDGLPISSSVREELIRLSLAAGLVWIGKKGDSTANKQAAGSFTIQPGRNAIAESVRQMSIDSPQLLGDKIYGLPFASEDVESSVSGPSHAAFLLKSGQVVRLGVKIPHSNESVGAAHADALDALEKQIAKRRIRIKHLDQQLSSAESKVFPVSPPELKSLCEVTGKSSDECERVLRRLRPRPSRLELAMSLLMGGASASHGRAGVVLHGDDVGRLQHELSRETRALSQDTKRRSSLQTECKDKVAKDTEDCPHVVVGPLQEWVGPCKFVQIASTHSNLYALGDDGKLYFWEWRSDKRGEHSRTPKMCDSQSIAKVASSAWRISVLTMQGEVASFMDECCHCHVDPPSTLHRGVTCDKSGMNPLVGTRFKLAGKNYDVCEAEFKKLKPEEKVKYVKIAYPGAEQVRVKSGVYEEAVPMRPSVPSLEHKSMLICADDKVVDIAVSDYGTAALTQRSSVYYWGRRRFGDKHVASEALDGVAEHRRAVSKCVDVCGASQVDIAAICRDPESHISKTDELASTEDGAAAITAAISSYQQLVVALAESHIVVLRDEEVRPVYERHTPVLIDAQDPDWFFLQEPIRDYSQQTAKLVNCDGATRTVSCSKLFFAATENQARRVKVLKVDGARGVAIVQQNGNEHTVGPVRPFIIDINDVATIISSDETVAMASLQPIQIHNKADTDGDDGEGIGSKFEAIYQAYCKEMGPPAPWLYPGY